MASPRAINFWKADAQNLKRKVEGLKLGQIVAKDLMKRLPSGSANKVASRDPCVELDVSGKHLTDTGFAELALGLTCSLTCEGEHGKVVRLEELCLAGNSLSAASLWLLSQVVRLAADDLRDLDVSGNGITVANEEEAWAWELFLRSFRSCVVLRRLDFSGNCLGSRAFEIFARVYGREEPLDFLTLDEAECGDPLGRVGGPSARMVESNDSDPGKIASTVGSRTPQKDPLRGDTVPIHPAQALAPHHTYATTRGLRSVPYIFFVDTSMEDTCAMHLSYVLANHSLPEQLLLYVPTAKSGPAQQLEVYDTRFGCHGIVYLPNDKLGSAGIKVLEMAEFARERSSDESAQGNQSPSKTPARTAGYPRRVSDATFSLPTGQAQGQRRSTVSSGSIDHSTYAGRGSVVTNELDRARSRIQSNVLKECGSQAVELWSASLKMLNIARQILPAGRRRQSEGSYHRQRDVSVDFSRLRPTYASKLMVGAYVPGEPVLNITGISSNPTTPTVLQRRKASTSDAPTGRGRSADMSSDLQMSRLSVMIKTSPEGSPMPFGLPEKLWGRIIALAADAIGVVNEVQQDSILRWATDRDTLIREMDALGKPESEQIWRLLEGMGCLAYVSDLDALLEG